MPTSRAGVSNSDGFTMVELAMVVLILGIVGAVALPRFGGLLDQQEMRRTVNVLHGTVRYLQARAAFTKRVYRLTLNFEAQTLSVCYLTAEACQREPSRELRDYTLPTAVRLLDVVTPGGEKVAEGEVAVHFHPTGLVEPYVLHLGGTSVQGMTLVIQPLIGGIKVFEGYVDPQAA